MSKDDLDLMFEAARKAPPEPSMDFMARVLSDAETLQPAAAKIAPDAERERGFSLSGLIQVIGGWPAVAGLAAATVAGVWIGMSPPSSLSSPLSAAFGDMALLSESVDFGGGFDFTLFEG